MELKKQYYCVKIVLYKGYHTDKTVYYHWCIPFNLLLKYKWYFEYLAALVKVSNPREKVVLHTGEQTLLAGEEYIEWKTKTLLRAKRSQLKKLQAQKIDDDLFSYTSEKHSEKKAKLQHEIERLEAGHFDYWVMPTYINRIKEVC